MIFIEHSIVLWLIYLPPEETILSEFLILAGSARRLGVRGLSGHAGEFGAEHGADPGVDPDAAVDEPLAMVASGRRVSQPAAIV